MPSRRPGRWCATRTQRVFIRRREKGKTNYEAANKNEHRMFDTKASSLDTAKPIRTASN